MSRILMFLLMSVLVVSVFGCSTNPGDTILAPGNARMGVATGQGSLGNPGVLPPGSTPFGKSYAEWSAGWWQWLASVPLDRNPGLDETGAFVGEGQSGHVWYLAPNYGGYHVRNAVIPPGTALFIDVIGYETSTREGLGTTEAELRGNAAAIADLMENISCEVDGVQVTGIDAYRFASSEMFSLTVPDDNVFDLWGVPTDAGTYYPSVADGYYVMLAPLSAGTHVIHIHGELPVIDYVTDVTFNLTVQSQQSTGHGGHQVAAGN